MKARWLWVWVCLLVCVGGGSSRGYKLTDGGAEFGFRVVRGGALGDGACRQLPSQGGGGWQHASWKTINCMDVCGRGGSGF